MSAGCNRLIRDCKAGLIENAADLLEQAAWPAGGRIRPGRERSIPDNWSDFQRDVYRIIAGADGAVSLDDLKERTAGAAGPPAGALHGILVAMEMEGFIRSVPGSRFAKA
jgi:predicted Rossmann fold nucleotide-binding protein DprA/Smf involved in DNA uptake